MDLGGSIVLYSREPELVCNSISKDSGHRGDKNGGLPSGNQDMFMDRHILLSDNS